MQIRGLRISTDRGILMALIHSPQGISPITRFPILSAIVPGSGTADSTSAALLVGTGLTETATVSFTGSSPSGGSTHYVEAGYSGDANYSSSTSGTTPLVSPWISTLLPSTGTPGTFVRIEGSDFGTQQSGSGVTFNGVSAQITSWSPTVIEAIAPPVSSSAPSGVTTGPVVVTECDSICNTSNPVVFTAPSGPTITGLSPSSGAIGTNVTVSGYDFGTSGTVTFNGIAAVPTSWGDESIITFVPLGATSGTVLVTSNGATSNRDYSFTVGLTITGISPTEGCAGTVVTIRGSGFGSQQDYSVVSFNGTIATPTNWSDGRIIVPVPSGASTGNITVVVNGLEALAPFLVLPSITSLSPSSGPVGTIVTVFGSNFGPSQGVSKITFGQAVAVPTQWSQNSIVVPVPSGAVTGPVQVWLGGVTSSNAVTFTVASTVPPGAAISGTVTQPDGVTPITGATVTVLQGSSATATTVTNSSGSYSISNLNAAAYNVQATAFGYGIAQQSGISVNSGQTATVNFSLSGRPTISYTYDELGRLVGVTDSINGAAGYSYDAVGNISGITRTSVGQASLLDFTPKAGAIGSAVTITGTSFSSNVQQDTVTFAGTAAAVNSATSTQLTATVPAGAVSGPITVTTPSGTATSSSSFTVTAPPVGLSITSFTPALGNAGTGITIAGTDFDTLSNDLVKFDGTPASLTAASPTSISTTVPASASSGPITIETPAGSAASISNFFVVPTSYTPSQVDFTGQMSINGSYTGTIQNAGDIGLLVFNAASGQEFGLQITGSTIGSGTISILTPSGASLTQSSFGTGSSLVGSLFAPVTGIYTILVASGTSSTGSLTVGLPLASPQAITSGVAQTVTTTTAGESAQFTFSGTAGQYASVTLTNNTFSACNVNVSILTPTGSTLASTGICGSSGILSPVALPTTGTYTLLIAPQNWRHRQCPCHPVCIQRTSRFNHFRYLLDSDY